MNHKDFIIKIQSDIKTAIENVKNTERDGVGILIALVNEIDERLAWTPNETEKRIVGNYEFHCEDRYGVPWVVRKPRPGYVKPEPVEQKQDKWHRK